MPSKSQDGMRVITRADTITLEIAF